METKEKMIKIKTQIGYSEYKKFYMFSIFKGRLYKVGPILFYIISTLTVLGALFSGFSYGFDVIDIVVISLLTFLIILMGFLMFITPRLYYKSARKFIEATGNYNFGEEYMIVESISESANGSSKIMYSALHKVNEINDLIFIFISNVQAFIIPKKNCSSDSIEDLRKILQSRVKKYKNYSKKKY